MAYSDRIGVWPRDHAFRPCLLLAGMFAVYSASLQAAPITLQFEAVVGPPRQGTFPIELPFSFAEGDRISGAFTFEPHDAPSNSVETLTVQNAIFRFEVDSYWIQTSAYELRATNNSVSDENAIPEDRIDLRCAFGGNLACIPQSIPGKQNIEWAFFGAFVGSGNVLDGADLPADEAIWNQLLPGSLLFTFSDTNIQKSTGFIATIDSIHIVPEPSTLEAIATLCIVAPVVSNLRGRRPK